MIADMGNRELRRRWSSGPKAGPVLAVYCGLFAATWFLAGTPAAFGAAISTTTVTPSSSPSASAGPSTSDGSPSPTPTGTAASPSASATAPTASSTSTGTPTPGSTAAATTELTPRPTGASPTASPGVSALTSRQPGTPAAVTNSGIPVTSILFALLVLGSAVLTLRAAYRRAGAPVAVAGPSDRRAPHDTHVQVGLGDPASAAVTSSFLVALGEAMIDAGDSVTHATSSLQQVARANAHDAQIVVLATALFVTVPGTDSVETAVAAAGTARLRLDQIDGVFKLVDAAERGRVRAADGLVELARIRSTPPPFGAVARVFGYLLLTLGVALVLRAGWQDLVLAGALGLVVGGLQLTSERYSAHWRVFLPVVCSFGVSLAVFLLARTDLNIGNYAPLIAPLVTFLPGALLTTSMIELATGQMISGAGRLAAGSMQLVLLALGVVAAGELVGVPAASIASLTSQPIGAWAPWVGVAAFACGVVVHNCARPASMGWIVLVLYVAYSGQVLGGVFFGSSLSGFFGALLMTPVAMLASTQRSGPPTLVSFLPGFWLLVPGAIGLVGVTQYLGAASSNGAQSLLTAAEAMVGIALGVLLGLAAGEVLAATTHRLQSGRG